MTGAVWLRSLLASADAARLSWQAASRSTRLPNSCDTRVAHSNCSTFVALRRVGDELAVAQRVATQAAEAGSVTLLDALASLFELRAPPLAAYDVCLRIATPLPPLAALRRAAAATHAALSHPSLAADVDADDEPALALCVDVRALFRRRVRARPGGERVCLC